MSDLYVGLDIGAESHQVVAYNEAHELIMEGKVTQSLHEISLFIKELHRLKTKHNYQDVIVGMESSNGYAAPLDRMLTHAGFKLIAVNSVTIDQYRKLVGQPRKDDPYDARLICKYLIDIYHLKGMKQNAQEMRNPDQTSTGNLRVLTRHYRTTKRDLTRVTNRLRKHILGYFPDFLQVFGDLNTKTARALLRQFNTVSQVKQVRATTIAKIKINSKRGVGAKAAAKLKALVKKIDYLDPMEEAMSQRTRDLVAHLDILFVQLENLKQQIEVIANESQDIRQIAENVAGAGLVNASELMAEIGDISRFANRDKLTIYCGIGCLNHSSGKMVSAKKPTHMNHHAKNALCLMALAALRHDPESKTYYDKKRQEGKKHWHAIKCLAKYLLRKIFTLLNQNSQSCPLAQAA